MADKVQKIREWISKEQDGLMDAQGNFEYPEHEGAYHILCNLDAYIDSIQDVSETDFGKKEEHKFKVGQSIRQGNVVAKIAEVSEEGYHCDNAFVPFAAQDSWELVEEPVSDETMTIRKEWFEHCKKSWYNEGYIDGKYNRKSQFEKPVSEGLEEAAIAYNKKVNFVCVGEIPNEHFIAGAKWQKEQDKETIEMEKMKEQMMEKAIETTFNVSLPSGLYDKLWIKGCKEGDKLLVIKKDEL